MSLILPPSSFILRKVRINAYLASCGLGSRRSVESLVLDGRIKVNHKVIRDLAFQVSPTDPVYLDGKAISPTLARFIMLHKPVGFACTRYDPYCKKTIYDLLPSELAQLKYAGRLDIDSEGLLLLSNDGAWLQQVSHPSHEVSKTYEVEVSGQILSEDLQAIKKGIHSKGELLKADSIEILKQTEKTSQLRIVLSEGRNREIRRIMGALHYPVTQLKRIAIGKLLLGSLKIGAWRDLTVEEVKLFKITK